MCRSPPESATLLPGAPTSAALTQRRTVESGIDIVNGAAEALNDFWVPSSDWVVGLAYDGLVTQLCAWASSDFSIDSVLHWLGDSCNVRTEGTCRVYRPQARQWVVVSDVSPRVAVVVARLLEDDRLIRLIEGRRRNGGSAYIDPAPTRLLIDRASGVDPFKPSSRSTDGFMRVELAPATRVLPQPKVFQPNPSTSPQQVYVDDLLAAENAVPDWPVDHGPYR